MFIIFRIIPIFIPCFIYIYIKPNKQTLSLKISATNYSFSLNVSEDKRLSNFTH
ncbi:hypothetical protein HanXRQr2_Chr17g0807071 [Helianthus annuus]|uniref:Uncharacterized protein n=1 Tax=Helianthus annuus TaxID=4232 RepID=A0A9K3DKW4_HELAN|nr:hypothetical protein HanXRQr2_Chr17g0807071 [Helianthus annuus]